MLKNISCKYIGLVGNSTLKKFLYTVDSEILVKGSSYVYILAYLLCIYGLNQELYKIDKEMVFWECDLPYLNIPNKFYFSCKRLPQDTALRANQRFPSNQECDFGYCTRNSHFIGNVRNFNR